MFWKMFLLARLHTPFCHLKKLTAPSEADAYYYMLLNMYQTHPDLKWTPGTGTPDFEFQKFFPSSDTEINPIAASLSLNHFYDTLN